MEKTWLKTEQTELGRRSRQKIWRKRRIKNQGRPHDTLWTPWIQLC
jgi:hypothetical protein